MGLGNHALKESSQTSSPLAPRAVVSIPILADATFVSPLVSIKSHERIRAWARIIHSQDFLPGKKRYSFLPRTIIDGTSHFHVDQHLVGAALEFACDLVGSGSNTPQRNRLSVVVDAISESQMVVSCYRDPYEACLCSHHVRKILAGAQAPQLLLMQTQTAITDAIERYSQQLDELSGLILALERVEGYARCQAPRKLIPPRH